MLMFLTPYDSLEENQEILNPHPDPNAPPRNTSDAITLTWGKYDPWKLETGIKRKKKKQLNMPLSFFHLLCTLGTLLLWLLMANLYHNSYEK